MLVIAMCSTRPCFWS